MGKFVDKLVFPFRIFNEVRSIEGGTFSELSNLPSLHSNGDADPDALMVLEDTHSD